MRKTLIAGGIALGMLAAGAGVADAAGTYTRGGDVLVTLAVSGGCATITWPKGTTSTTCDTYQTYQHDIQPGDTFGAKIVSHTGGGVACSVRDVESGDRVGEDSAGPGYTANCIYHAKTKKRSRGNDNSSSNGSSAFGSS